MIKSERRRFFLLMACLSFSVLFLCIARIYDFETVRLRLQANNIAAVLFEGAPKEDWTMENENLLSDALIKSEEIQAVNGAYGHKRFKKFRKYRDKDQIVKVFDFDITLDEAPLVLSVVYEPGHGKYQLSDILFDGVTAEQNEAGAGQKDKTEYLEEALILENLIEIYNKEEFAQIYVAGSSELKLSGDEASFVKYMDYIFKLYGRLSLEKIEETSTENTTGKRKVTCRLLSGKQEKKISMTLWITGTDLAEVSGLKFYEGHW